MKIEAYNEQKKLSELQQNNEYGKTSGAKETFSGIMLTEAVNFQKNNHKENIFATGTYGNGEQEEDAPKTMQDIQSEAEVLKSNIKAICNKMDMGELVVMDEEGVDINDTEVEKIVTVAEQIRIKMAAYGNGDVYVGDIDSDAVKAVLGENVAYMVADKLSEYSYPVTEENLEEIAASLTEAEQLKAIDSNAKLYLMKNNMSPTVSNIYMAEHSGNYGSNYYPISDSQWENIRPQIDKLLNEVGIEGNQEVLNDMRNFINNGVSITEESLGNYKDIMEASELIEGLNSENTETALIYKEALVDKMVATMVDRQNAKDVNMSDQPVAWQNAKHAMEVINSVTIEGLSEFLGNNYDNTLEGLEQAEFNVNILNPANQVNEAAETVMAQEIIPDISIIRNIADNPEAVSNLRRLMELRLMMTFESAYVLEKNGISVNTTELELLVDELRKLEGNGLSGKESISSESTQKTADVMNLVNGLRTAPVNAIADTIEWKQINLHDINERAMALKKQYEDAGRAYETMATKVTPDLGDNVEKAVAASADSILRDLDLENREENKRAIRILADNNMEITIENINRVKEVDNSLNELFDKMTPQIAYDMIKEGMDILNMDLQIVVSEVENRTIDDEEAIKRFSEYLYKLNNNGEISEEDREKYMGLYTIIKKLTKDNGKAAGFLVNQNMPVNLSNLITAYMSGNVSGMNYSINSTDIVEDRENKNEHNNAKLSYYKDVLSELGTVADPEWELLSDAELPHTVNNLLAAKYINRDGAHFFKGAKRNNVETSLDRFLDEMDSKENLINEYEEITEYMKEAVQAKDKGKETPDVKYLKQLSNGISVINSLANNNTFYVPYDSESGMRAIKLKVVENSEEAGSFTIDMVSVEYGHLYVSARVSDGELSSYILFDKNKAQNNEAVSGLLADIEEQLTALGFDKVKVNSLTTNDFPKMGKASSGKTETKKLFSAAKVFIENFR